MKKNFLLLLLVLLTQTVPGFASRLFIPMDAEGQKNHLKAYGVAYACLKLNIPVDWLLNFRGGSFSLDQNEAVERLCKIRGVNYEILTEVEYGAIVQQVADPDNNADIIKLEKAPRVAVYTPKGKHPWDDAVTLVLEYAEIPFDKVYDDEVLENKLPEYDWLHLHHEDFTGQYGKFWGMYRFANWYQEDVKLMEEIAHRNHFSKVSKLKLAVAKKIRDFVAGGGYLFAMCSATDSYDIALAAENTDICDLPFDGDPMAPDAQQKLDFSKCFAFQNFRISQNAAEYEYSNIDATTTRRVPMEEDYFSLFSFSAKFDPVPSMLCQNHTDIVKGFMGQTTAFRKDFIKSSVLVMGENKGAQEARYIHGELGKGTWTFYGGHDPEDYQHLVGNPHTDLSLHPSSPGYRLILNNVLFPAAKKKPRKT